MRLRGNHYSAIEDRRGNITITRLVDGASVFLQGDDAIEFLDNHRILDTIEYPSGPFKTSEEHVDACLDQYDNVMLTLLKCPNCGNSVSYSQNVRVMARCIECHTLFEANNAERISQFGLR